MCAEVNTLSNEEVVEIIGSLKYTYQKEFQCFNPSKYDQFKESTKDLRRKQVETENNCQGLPTKTVPTWEHKHKDLNFMSCPCNFYNPAIIDLVEMWQRTEQFGFSSEVYKYKVKEVSTKTVACFRIIAAYINRMREDRRMKQEQEAKRRG